MVDPYPERRRRDRLDRTDHHRATERGPLRDRGPSESRIEDALDKVASHDVPGTPPHTTLEILRAVHESVRMTDTRRLRDFSITRGDPQHGEYRSDDHIGRYEVALPFAEVSDDAYAPDECRECGGDRAVYKYRALHHISGYESLFCARCEEKVCGEGWG